MKKTLFILLPFLWFSCNVNNGNLEDPPEQEDEITIYTITPQIYIDQLANVLTENSGLIFYDSLLWTMNDGGGENKIYGCNFSGGIEREVEIEDATNVDWESITQDDQYIYIGDFGNNMGNRKDQSIYKIKKSELTKESSQQIPSEKIEFSYINQEEFNYDAHTTPFDCGAMTENDGALYIFTKDWSNLTTTSYSIPIDKGKYTLNPMENFDVNGLLTGASFSPDKKKLSLLGYSPYHPILWIFSNFSSGQFFNGDMIKIEMPSLLGSQTEGICFLNNDSILISCEGRSGFTEQVFLIDLNSLE